MNLLWLWGVIVILLALIAALLIKIYLMKKAAEEIREAFMQKHTTDTNTLIGLSTNDRHMRRLAAVLNKELAALRSQRRRFCRADSELKNAITNISHDLRTPLTAIYAYLDLLEQEEKSEAACRYIEIIRGRADLLKTLTEELFRYSVITSAESDIQQEKVVLNEVLEESIASFYAELKEHNITPQIQITEKKILRSLDRAALSRVFSNLLSNALKYSNGDLAVTLSENGEIIFTNTAPGLNHVEVGKLFDRFYTVDSPRKSTGLGLAIARSLVDQMNGSIWAEYENERLAVHICFRTESALHPE